MFDLETRCGMGGFRPCFHRMGSFHIVFGQWDESILILLFGWWDGEDGMDAISFYIARHCINTWVSLHLSYSLCLSCFLFIFWELSSSSMVGMKTIGNNIIYAEMIARSIRNFPNFTIQLFSVDYNMIIEEIRKSKFKYGSDRK